MHNSNVNNFVKEDLTDWFDKPKECESCNSKEIFYDYSENKYLCAKCGLVQR